MINTFFKKIKSPKVYSNLVSTDSSSTLIHYENWSSSGPIEYEILTKDAINRNTLIFERKSSHHIKTLKFKRKPSGLICLINDKDNNLASVSKKTNQVNEIQWDIQLNEIAHWEKLNYSNFIMSTKDGKLYKVIWKHHGQLQTLDLRTSSSAAKNWSIIYSHNNSEIATFQFDDLSFKKLGSVKIIEIIELPEPIILIIFGIAIMQSELIKRSLKGTTINISV